MKPEPNPNRPLRVGMISLGCAKNLVDAEIMLGALMKDGLEITNDAAQADVVIVNTCSFIDAAQEESVDTILESAEVRKAQNRGQGLVVSGCLSQRYREELPKLLPEVDAFMGIDQVAEVGKIVRQAVEHRAAKLAAPKRMARSKRQIQERLAALEKARPAHDRDHHDHDEKSMPGSSVSAANGAAALAPIVQVNARPQFISDFATPRFRLTPRHFAYLKIAEGCNHPCSFCIIPRMRGSHRSRPQADIVREARELLAQGVKEINLISQDSTYYGLDLRPNRSGSIASPQKFQAATESLPASAATLSTLLRELNQLPGDFWIRLLYTHPAHWTDELIETIAACPKVARYIDIPLQHIHGAMLERMRRETSREYIVDLIRRIRAGIPGIAIRTTFIVGFPGETEESFQTLLEFIRETKFERLGVFTYSQEPGTRAAAMSQQIPDEVKQRRREEAMAEQLKVARTIAESQVGKTIKVLVEKKATARDLNSASVSSWEHGLIRSDDQAGLELKGQYYMGRAQADAPDIDGRVYIQGRSLPVGEFVEVKVAGHTDYDLIAKPLR